jgi:outer membrane receptor protein involved in Fe transport
MTGGHRCPTDRQRGSHERRNGEQDRGDEFDRTRSFRATWEPDQTERLAERTRRERSRSVELPERLTDWAEAFCETHYPGVGTGAPPGRRHHDGRDGGCRPH